VKSQKQNKTENIFQCWSVHISLLFPKHNFLQCTIPSQFIQNKSSMNHIVEQVCELGKSLESTEVSIEVGLDILKILDEMVLTLKIIEQTRIPAIVRRFKKKFPENEEINHLSSHMITKWKEIYDSCEVRGCVVGGGGGEGKVRDIKRISPSVQRPRPKFFSETCTITFGDQAENHVGMQKIGSLASEGFSKTDLEVSKSWFDERGIATELIALHDSLPEAILQSHPGMEAYVLIARGGVSVMLDMPDGADKLMWEQRSLERDTKAFMKGRVVNKHARYNLCFGSFDQEPDYENKKGRVVSFGSVPLLQRLREGWEGVVGAKGAELEAEGNYYYDLAKCGIGYHGDTERRKVIAVRLGASMPLCYLWFQDSIVVSQRIDLTLQHGDVYFMSEKATGQDWLKKKVPTLRHAAGSRKFIEIPKKNMR
jgi:hypothetical protein